MSLGRRKVRLEDPSAWVFNRMVGAYEARPAYPPALVEALAQLAGAHPEKEGHQYGGKRERQKTPPKAQSPQPHPKGVRGRSGISGRTLAGGKSRIGDIGAGIGHLALPLAARGFRVTAVEPARLMLERLGARAQAQDLSVSLLHGMAERMTVPDAAFDLVIVSDAVHFLDSERAAYEVKRVLAPGGALALVTCEFAPTPFMQALGQIMRGAAPRRPRNVTSALTQLLAVPQINELAPQVFSDETPVTPSELAQILRSISFIGPAMNPERAAAFLKRVHAIPHPAKWARTFTLRSGWRKANECKAGERQANESVATP